MSKDIPRDSDLANYAEKFLNIDKGQQLFFGFIFIGLLIKFLSISDAVTELITSPFLLTLFTTHASKAIGSRSIFFAVSISGKNFFKLAIEAIDKYLSFSSLTIGFIRILANAVLYLKFIIKARN